MTIRVYEELDKLWHASSQDKTALVFGKLTTIKKSFGKALDEAKIKDFHFHDTRATSISRMIAAGMPPAEVMRVSGHTTLRAFYIYVRTDRDTAYRAAALLDALNIESSVQEANTIVH
jgi:integrase